jgi:hypothetical protein
MTRRRNLHTLVSAAALLVVVGSAQKARGGWLADWFGWYPTTTYTAGYYYVPETAYRTLYEPVAVASYAPAATCGTFGATTAYMPVTTYVQRPVLQTYTSYRVVAMPVVAQPACTSCATAYYAPAPACSSCGCGSCGGGTCGCSSCASGACGGGSCGCASCGYAPACSSCGCAGGAGGTAALIGAPAYPAAATSPPALTYAAPGIAAPITSTPYLPPETAAYPQAISSPVVVNSWAPSAVAPNPAYSAAPMIQSSIGSPGAPSTTYSMPISPPAVNYPLGAVSVQQQGTPTVAPPNTNGETSPADVQPSMPGPAGPTSNSAPSSAPTSAPPTPQSPPPASPPAGPSTQPGSKTFDSTPNNQPPIPDNRSPSSQKSTGTSPDPNGRTAYTMPMMRPGATHYQSPWPIAKTTAALMPVEPAPSVDDADGWRPVR